MFAISEPTTAEVVSPDSFTLSPVAEAAVCRMPAEANDPEGLRSTLVKVAAGAAMPNEFDGRAGMLPVPATSDRAAGVVPVPVKLVPLTAAANVALPLVSTVALLLPRFRVVPAELTLRVELPELDP